MPTTKNEGGPPDARHFMDLCLKAEKGGQQIFETWESAKAMSFRCYTTRSREGKRNRKLYSDYPDHKLFGKSIYDKLSFKIIKRADGKWALIGIHDPEALLKLQGDFEAL